jgi:hypothetical protein
MSVPILQGTLSKANEGQPELEMAGPEFSPARPS